MNEFVRDYVVAAADTIGLELHEAHLPGVVANMERIAALAKLVNDFPLQEEVEPLPAYRP
jgi:hypothetical protein